MRPSVLLIVPALLPAPVATAQTEPFERPDGVMLLIQSELDYVDVAGQRISIDFREASPALVLSTLEKKTGLSIEIHGRLREEPRLTATFRFATVKRVLEWFARETGVCYRAEGPHKLLVLVPMAQSDV